MPENENIRHLIEARQSAVENARLQRDILNEITGYTKCIIGFELSGIGLALNRLQPNPIKFVLIKEGDVYRLVLLSREDGELFSSLDDERAKINFMTYRLLKKIPIL